MVAVRLWNIYPRILGPLSLVGALTLRGPGRIAKEINLEAEHLGIGATKPIESIAGRYVVQTYGINDDSVAVITLPSDWDESTDIEIYVHWACNEAYSANNGEVRWQVSWAAVPKTATEDYSSPTHTGSGDTGDIDIPATARYAREDLVVSISAASLSAEDCVGFEFKRIALVGGSDPGAEPEVLAIHIHYIANKLGRVT